MSYGDDGNDEATVIDLVNNAVIADADAVGVASFKLLTTGWPGVVFQLHHFIFDPGSDRSR